MEVHESKHDDINYLLSLLDKTKEDAPKFHIYSAINEKRASKLLLDDLKQYASQGMIYLAKNRIIRGLAGISINLRETRSFGFNCASLDYILTRDNDSIKSLLSEVDGWAGRNGVRFIEAKINSQNERLLEFLVSEGFEQIDKLVTLRNRLLGEYEVSGTKIRSVREDELEAVGRIASESFIHSRFFKDTNFRKEDVRRRYYDRAIDCCSTSDNVLVAEKNREITGFVTCDIEEIRQLKIKYGEIQLFAADKRYQGQGVGTALLAAASEWFRENGCMFVDVSTESDNAASIRVYKKNGFEQAYSQLRLHKMQK